jgi:hypothetical protein
MKLMFVEQPARQYKWAAYGSPQNPDFLEVWHWCCSAFGALGDCWESHGGWIQLRTDEELIIFKLRWQ